MSLYLINDDSLVEVKKTTFAEESILERSHLQAMLKKNIGIIVPDAMVLAEEYRNWEDSKRRIDLLCLDKEARLVVVELKRSEDGGHMDLQAIRYASMISKMTFSEAVRAHQEYINSTEEEARSSILSFLGWIDSGTEEFGSDVRVILASAEFSKELMTSVMWLSEKDVDLCCMRLKPYTLEGKTLVDVQKIFPLPEAEDYQIKIREKEREERAERHFRSQSRDLTRFNLRIDGKDYKNLPKRFLAFWVIRHALQKGAHPTDIINNARSWVIVDGKCDSNAFLKAAALQRSAGSSRSEIERFFIEEDQIFHIDEKTYALTKMWGDGTLRFVDELIANKQLFGVSYEPVQEEI